MPGRGVIRLEQHDAIGAWVFTSTEGCERSLAAKWEGGREQVVGGGECATVGMGGRDENDQPSELAVPLLQRPSPELGLGVAKASDGLNRDGRVGVPENGVEGAEVAGDVDGRLELPVPGVAHDDMQPAKEGQLRLIAEAGARWVEAGVKAQANHSGVAGQVGDAKTDEAPALDPAYMETRGSCGAGNIGLAEAPAEAGVTQLDAELALEATADEPCVVDTAHPVGHLEMVATASYRAITYR